MKKLDLAENIIPSRFRVSTNLALLGGRELTEQHSHIASIGSTAPAADGNRSMSAVLRKRSGWVITRPRLLLCRFLDTGLCQ
jgi:hypothetical protein